MAKPTSYPEAFIGQTTDVHTTAQNVLGTRCFDKDGNEFIYLTGVASTAAGDLVTYDELFITTRSVAAAVGPCAVACAATIANTYGWYQILGSRTIAVSAAVADNGKVFLTATPGATDDTSVAGDQVVGAIYRAAAGGAGTVLCQLDHPKVGVNVA